MEIKSQNQEQEDYGQTLISWRAPEYEQHERGKNWYIATFTLGAFLVGSSVWMKNYLMIIIVALFGIVIYLLNKKEVLMLDIKATNRGILIGEKFYPYTSLEEFWLIYEPPIRTLNFKNNRSFFPEVSVSLADQDPSKIREILIKYVNENASKTEATTTDRLSKLLKI